MNRRAWWLLPLIALTACGSEPPDVPPSPRPALRALRLEPAQAGGGQAWDGVVEAVQQAQLSAQTAGRISAVNVDVGDAVKRGDVLMRITAFEQQAGVDAARAQLNAAEASLKETESSYRRFESLASQQYVSKAQLDQVRSARDSAIAARDASRAQLRDATQQSEYTVVRAPFDGLILRRSAELGETVSAGQPLVSLYVPGALRVQVAAPQTEAADIRRAGSARILLDDGRRIEVQKLTVFPSADADAHSVGVRMDLPPVDDAPLPGMAVKVVFPLGTATRTLRIPASALVQRGEVSGVYVIDGDRIVLRQIRLGAQSGSGFEVVSGLKPGERIAADPVAAVQAIAAQREGKRRE